jgi:hypothetical protein
MHHIQTGDMIINVADRTTSYANELSIWFSLSLNLYISLIAFGQILSVFVAIDQCSCSVLERLDEFCLIVIIDLVEKANSTFVKEESENKMNICCYLITNNYRRRQALRSSSVMMIHDTIVIRHQPFDSI